jgi:hypothetical protein
MRNNREINFFNVLPKERDCSKLIPKQACVF